MTSSERFHKAHMVAREIRDYFPTYRDAFAFALRETYEQEAVMQNEMTMEQKLEALGISAWEKNGMRRYYINADKVEAVFGLEIGRYNTGNISSARLNGEHISNTKAGKLLARKIYFDAVSREWMQSRPGCYPESLCNDLYDALRI